MVNEGLWDFGVLGAPSANRDPTRREKVGEREKERERERGREGERARERKRERHPERIR